jgi:hypothetical protein
MSLPTRPVTSRGCRGQVSLETFGFIGKLLKYEAQKLQTNAHSRQIRLEANSSLGCSNFSNIFNGFTSSVNVGGMLVIAFSGASVPQPGMPQCPDAESGAPNIGCPGEIN